MGSPVSAVIANMVMEDVEQRENKIPDFNNWLLLTLILWSRHCMLIITF